MRQFNTRGICDPQKNYMVDVSDKAREILCLVDEGEYFVINRARQYGKTNMLLKLEQMLQGKSYVLRLSFQDAGFTEFSSEQSFVSYFMILVLEEMKQKGFPENLCSGWKNTSEEELPWVDRSFPFLRRKMQELCRLAEYPVVMMIDEVDSVSNNEVFLKFLAVLRESYLGQQAGRVASFQSVILAGVTDIRNLKGKIRAAEEHRVNSPWNIAADFTVDMSFSVHEIAGMLRDYEADHLTGMDVRAVSQEIRYLTAGYPYIVSWICKKIDTDKKAVWSVEGVRDAGRAFLSSRNDPLLDDLRKNVDNNPEFKNCLIQMLYYEKKYSFTTPLPAIDLGIMYGILSKDDNGNAVVSNPLFEKYLYDYTVELALQMSENNSISNVQDQFVQNKRLNMVQVLNRFQVFLCSEYRQSDGAFLEQQGRLLFLCFLKPIINGTGHYFVEAETRDSDRMDVVVVYGKEEYIVELKIWRGEQYRKRGIQQLEKYMEGRGTDIGFLISFSFLKDRKFIRRWLPPDETKKNIYEIII